jgi:DNA gyrase/topoisomerase IV subunit B
MRPLIEEGYVYLAKPPLYKIFNEKRIEYAYSDRELEQVKKKLGAGFQVQRYKGLGEMDASQLWDTTMNPDSRTLCRVTIDDAVMANKLITILMGNKTEPRRKYIMDHINMEVL